MEKEALLLLAQTEPVDQNLGTVSGYRRIGVRALCGRNWWAEPRSILDI